MEMEAPFDGLLLETNPFLRWTTMELLLQNPDTPTWAGLAEHLTRSVQMRGVAGLPKANMGVGGGGEVNSLPHLPWLGTNHLVFLSLDLYLATFSESNMWDFHFVTGRNFQKSSQCQFRTFPMIFRRLLNIAEIVQSCSNELWALYPELFQRRNMLCYS